MNDPLFSIIVPIFNIEKYLVECINSILNQSYTNYEVILVDDGSLDKCPEICEKYARQDNRIRVLHKENGGLVSARNAGVNLAKGKYVAYVDGDDWVAPNWLEVLHSTVKNSFPDVVCFNVYKSIDGKNQLLKTSNCIGVYDKKLIANEILPRMLYDNKAHFYTFGVLPAVWAKIVKTDILKKNLCKELKITFGEDAACTYGCILDAESFIGIDDILYYYRQNRESMTKAYDLRRFDRLAILFRYFENTLLRKNEAIEEQYGHYKAFCIFYAVLNEAKNNINLKDAVKLCQERMQHYEFDQYIVNYHACNFGVFWGLFHKLIQKEHYKLALIICRIIVVIKYSYKG